MKTTRDNQKLVAHLKAAKAYAELSYARRLKVGAVIVRDDRIVSIGYNGTPTGRDNNCEIEVKDEKQQGIFTEFPMTKLVSKPEVVHAEENAILFSARNGVKIEGCSLITTHSPCFECAKMIIQSGITHVYYEEDYRDSSPVVFLEECKIIVKKIEGEKNV